MEPFPEVHSGRQQEDSRRTAGRNVTEKRPAEGYSHISDEYHGKTQKRDRRSDPLSVIGDQSPPLSEISIILTQDVPYLERHNACLQEPPHARRMCSGRSHPGTARQPAAPPVRCETIAVESSGQWAWEEIPAGRGQVQAFDGGSRVLYETTCSIWC